MNNVHKIMHFCPFWCRQDTQKQKQFSKHETQFQYQGRSMLVLLALKMLYLIWSLEVLKLTASF